MGDGAAGKLNSAYLWASLTRERSLTRAAAQVGSGASGCGNEWLGGRGGAQTD